MVKLTFLGHACFLIEDGTHRLLVDPYLTGNPLAAVTADEAEADYIFITHGHGDHIGDAVPVAKRCGAQIITTVDLADSMLDDDDLRVTAGNIGGKVPLPFGSVRFFQAIHGSGAAGTLSSGFIFEIGGKKIYHAGDTALMTDMQLLAEEELDAALLPIGDFYTMGPQEALRAAKMIKARLTIPMHYNTFPHITQDGEAFAQSVREAGMNALVLQPGETIELG